MLSVCFSGLAGLNLSTTIVEMNAVTRILFVADIVGEIGVEVALRGLQILRESEGDVDYCVANGENLKRGRGIDRNLARKLFDNGIDALTGGNHVWDRQSDQGLLEEANVLRPANYPPGLPGRGWAVLKKTGKQPLALINLQGRTFLYSIDCPFRTADQILNEVEVAHCRIRVVDIHAEATAEKQALAWYLDGRVSAVIGTHTHVQTADATILDKGTGYITDAGMTGSHNGVIGMSRETAIRRFLVQTPDVMRLARGRECLNAVLLEIDNESGACRRIERIARSIVTD